MTAIAAAAKFTNSLRSVRLEFGKSLTILSQPRRPGAFGETVVIQRVGVLLRGKALFTLRQARQDFVAYTVL